MRYYWASVVAVIIFIRLVLLVLLSNSVVIITVELVLLLLWCYYWASVVIIIIIELCYHCYWTSVVVFVITIGQMLLSFYSLWVFHTRVNGRRCQEQWRIGTDVDRESENSIVCTTWWWCVCVCMCVISNHPIGKHCKSICYGNALEIISLNRYTKNKEEMNCQR